MNSATARKIKSKNSKIELMLGKAMYASGMQYIKNDTEILVLKMQKHIGA